MNALVQQAWPIILNDTRLFWRELMGGGQLSALRRYGTALVLLALLHAPVLLFFFLRKSPPPLGVETVLWLFFLVTMTGIAMIRAVVILYERSDFDLLLSAPVPFRVVLFARLVSIALFALLTVSIFVLPLLDSALLLQSPRYAAAFVVWALLAAIAGATGTGLTLVLVRALGVRRARHAAQIAGGFLAMGFMLVIMLPALLGPKGSRLFQLQFSHAMQHPIFAFLGRADRGQPLELALLAVVAAVALLLCSRLMANTFAAGVQSSGAHEAPRRRSGLHRWSAGLARTYVLKELRLIARHSRLLGAVGVTSMMFTVVVVVFFRASGVNSLPPMAVVVGSQFTFIFATFAAESESCWDLSRLSPVSELRLRLLKVTASAAAPVALAAAMCAWVVVAGRPWLALIGFLSTVLCAAGCAWIGLATVKPAPRQDVMQSAATRSVDPRQIATLAVFYPGAGGVALVGFGFPAWGAASLGVTALCVLGCFTLIEPRTEEAPAS